MGSGVRLNKAIEGIDVVIAYKGQALRALVCSSFLEERFAASQTPHGWLMAYRKHQAEIDALVVELVATGRSEPIILR